MSQFSEASMKIHDRNENLSIERHRLHVLCKYFILIAFNFLKGILANRRNITSFFFLKHNSVLQNLIPMNKLPLGFVLTINTLRSRRTELLKWQILGLNQNDGYSCEFDTSAEPGSCLICGP